jgi:hypothetical protein
VSTSAAQASKPKIHTSVGSDLVAPDAFHAATAKDRALALQNAFAAAHRDPQLLAEANAIGIDVSPVSAEELRHSIEKLSRAPPDLFDYVRRLLATGKGG